MRIAHIIIAHKNPEQLNRLLLKMQHPDFDFYIHVDKKIDIKPYEFLGAIQGVKFIQYRSICNWGGYSTLHAMVSSLKEVLLNQTEYGFYNLLSAQDYPLKSNAEICGFFQQNKEKSFIYYEGEGSKWWEGAVYRFQRYHLTDFNFIGKFFIENMLNKLLPPRKFPLSMKLYGGSKSSWWSLNKESSVYLANYFDTENKIKKFLKFCWGTDEFVIPTILMNSPLKERIVNDNLRYIDFPDGMANPKILRLADLDKMLSSQMLFARKFDIGIDIDILAAIDEHTSNSKQV